MADEVRPTIYVVLILDEVSQFGCEQHQSPKFGFRQTPHTSWRGLCQQFGLGQTPHTSWRGLSPQFGSRLTPHTSWKGQSTCSGSLLDTHGAV